MPELFWIGVGVGLTLLAFISVVLLARPSLWYERRKLNPRPRYDGVYEDAVKRMEGRDDNET